MSDLTCTGCKNRGYCVEPCDSVNKILWKDNRVMERHFHDAIVCYPQRGEVHFSELKDHQLDDMSQDDVIPWVSGDARLRQTTVFIERFFNKVPCRELAERFGVKENTIVCMYARAVGQLQKMIEAIDARREGMKATKGTRGIRFSDDQKFFLLINVFGFNGYEVAQMFNTDHQRVSLKAKRMADRYQAAFKQPESAYAGRSSSEILERMAM